MILTTARAESKPTAARERANSRKPSRLTLGPLVRAQLMPHHVSQIVGLEQSGLAPLAGSRKRR
jgi:hypothetical protein